MQVEIEVSCAQLQQFRVYYGPCRDMQLLDTSCNIGFLTQEISPFDLVSYEHDNHDHEGQDECEQNRDDAMLMTCNS